MKTASAQLNSHLQGESTSLATCWKLKRQVDDRVFGFTSVDRPITFDLGDGDGPVIYKSTSSFNRSALKNDDTLAVDNLDITGVLVSTDISESELRLGLFDFAEIKLFQVNHQDLSQGALKLRAGNIGETVITARGFFQAELRGLTQALQQRIIFLYGAECLADLGDSECKIPIRPPEILRNMVYNVGDFVRASNTKFDALTVTNGNAESGTTGWTNELGTLATRGALPAPQEGSNYFYGGTDAETIARQDVAVPGPDTVAIDLGDRAIRLRWIQNAFDEATDDQAEMQVEFLDAVSAQIGATVTTGLQSPIVWTDRGVQVAVPALTRTIRIKMRMLRQTGVDNDGLIDDIRLDLYDLTPLSEDFDDRIYSVATAGISALFQPTYITTPGLTTTDGTAVFTAEQAWSREIVVTAVDPTEPFKTFTVTELTPNSGGVTAGRDFFPDDSMNLGAVIWETGDNAGRGMEVKDFTADDGITIEQVVELILRLKYSVVVGDKARIYRGCDKTRPICKDIFANVVNFRGFPDVPGQDLLAQYPDAQA